MAHGAKFRPSPSFKQDVAVHQWDLSSSGGDRRSQAVTSQSSRNWEFQDQRGAEIEKGTLTSTVTPRRPSSLGLYYVYKLALQRAGEAIQLLRAVTNLPGNPGSVPNTHMAAHNHLKF